MAVGEAPRPSSRGPQLWPLSVQAYRTLGELGFIPKNTELLYGQIFQRGAKSPPHSALVCLLVRLLQQARPSGCFVSSEQPITCSDSEPEPDVAVIRGSEDQFWKEHPKTAEMAIGVCASSHDYERSKLRAYALAGVKEVWLILVPEKQIEVHLQPSDGQFLKRQTFGPGGNLVSVAVPQFAVELEELFAKV
jgi:Uma2 family endonuclease